MEQSGGTGLAAAVLDLVGSRPPDRAGVLGGLVAATHGLFGLAAGAALISDGVADGVVVAGPEGFRAALAAGFDRGPGDDCARSGRPVLCDDLLPHRPRWLAFVARATASGLTAAWALPIRRDSDAVGALLVLGRPQDRPDLTAADVLTQAAAVALREADDRESAEREIRQLRTGLHSRVLVEQAKGVLAAHAGLDVESAFELLRTYSRRNRRPLSEIAGAVVRGELSATVVAGRN